jgi:hypothetical protein
MQWFCARGFNPRLLMYRLLARIFGVSASKADRDDMFATMIGQRSHEAAIEFLQANVEHNTEKSGALLGAQAIFVVVDFFAVNHGWSQAAILPSMLFMLTGALPLMSNLRGNLGVYRRAERQSAGHDARALFGLIESRTLRFNAALYLTFLSILLLAVAMTGPRSAPG